ncbi:D-arabinono-1,4-lactone oxidase [Pseudonocardia humida]|uniref:FAD-binding protein n=1 Tax=Pseudonocardia humida TaxID=2800819 RepID=A0ABT1A170_9PSEU|nr:D-arabinono-1,4-lactone oxidase [Pseudonocardia humida]MCO1656660.1 FAD-binding protein [Pseudonocardia humida]
MTGRVTNWAGNVVFSADRLHRPGTVPELQELVAGAHRVRALGSGHSFSPIADSPGELVTVADLPRRIEIDAAAGVVTVSAGSTYGQVGAALHEAGFALPNTGSLPHISVAGACSTGTHGSGDGNGVLAGSVRAVELVAADGELRTFRRGDPDFPGAVVALGALGIVTALTLDLRPTFDVRQWVYEGLRSFDAVPDALSAAYSVSLFTRWAGAGFEQCWIKQLPDSPEPGPDWFGATPAPGPRHMLTTEDPANCTPQGGDPGPWHTRLPHFRAEFKPSRGDELQSEYLVPRETVVDALRALDAIADRIAPVLLVCEVRTIAADDLWLSPAHGRACAALHFTWVQDTAAVTPVVAAIERALEPFSARPHWGKVFTTAPSVVRSLYPRLDDAEELVARVDPEGKFGSEWLGQYLRR